ncbi:MAG TPA: hypothetical protein VKA50_11510 [Gammaproteobacteria bacterium]|nr:hypothetical protein [Gammaproteobacteria bacterium]
MRLMRDSISAVRGNVGSGPLLVGLLLGLAAALVDLGNAAAAQPDACRLLSDVQVHSLAPSLGKGRKSKANIPNVSGCVWPDAHGIPGLMLQVTPAPPGSLRDDLASGFGAMGYDIESVSGLGDEAAVAVQQANPKFGIKSGVAILSVRKGKRVLSLSPARIDVKPGSARYKRLKELAAEAISHL